MVKKKYVKGRQNAFTLLKPRSFYYIIANQHHAPTSEPRDVTMACRHPQVQVNSKQVMEKAWDVITTTRHKAEAATS
jgi:hypothetical protein